MEIIEIQCELEQCGLLHVIPVFEEASEAKSHKLEQGLDDEEEGEDIVAVRQSMLEILRRRQRKLF